VCNTHTWEKKRGSGSIFFFVFDDLTNKHTQKQKKNKIFNDFVSKGDLSQLRMSSSSPPVRAVEPFSSSLGGDLFGEEEAGDMDDVDAFSVAAKQPVRFSSPSPSPVQRSTVGNKGVPPRPTVGSKGLSKSVLQHQVPPPTKPKPVVPVESSSNKDPLVKMIVDLLRQVDENVVMKNFWDQMRAIFDLCRPTENAAVKDSNGVRMLVINNVVHNLTELKHQLQPDNPASPFLVWLAEIVRLLPENRRETVRNMCTVDAFTKKKKPGGPKSSAKSPKPREEEEEEEEEEGEREDSSDDDDDDSSGEDEELVSEELVSAMAKPAPTPPPKVAVSKKRPAEAPPAAVPPPPSKVQRNSSSSSSASSSSSSYDDWFQKLFDDVRSKFEAMKQTVSAMEQENHALKHGAGPLEAENKKLVAENQMLKAKNKKLNAMILAFMSSEENAD
jgi:hypothetical protein